MALYSGVVAFVQVASSRGVGQGADLNFIS